MHDKYGVEQDVYCYPESTVLTNLLDIREPDKLEEAEAEFTLARAQTYEPAFSNFDLNHLKKFIIIYSKIFTHGRAQFALLILPFLYCHANRADLSPETIPV